MKMKGGNLFKLFMVLFLMIGMIPFAVTDAYAAETINEVRINNVPELEEGVAYNSFIEENNITIPDGSDYTFANYDLVMLEYDSEGKCIRRISGYGDIGKKPVIGYYYTLQIEVVSKSKSIKFAETPALYINGSLIPSSKIKTYHGEEYSANIKHDAYRGNDDYIFEVDLGKFEGNNQELKVAFPDIGEEQVGKTKTLAFNDENGNSLYTTGGSHKISNVTISGNPDWFALKYDGTKGWYIKYTRPYTAEEGFDITLTITDTDGTTATGKSHVGATTTDGLITTVDVEFPTPEIGGSPKYAQVPEDYTGKYRVTATRWYDLATGNIPLDYNYVFEEGHEYSVYVEVRNDDDSDGLEFPANKNAITYKMNGKTGDEIDNVTIYNAFEFTDPRVAAASYVFDRVTKPQLTGNVQYTSAPYSGNRLTAVITGLPDAIKGNGATPSEAVKFQWQQKIDGSWTNISGATSQGYNIPEGTAAGTEYRLTVTAEGYEGKIVGSSITVKKFFNPEIPDIPELSVDTGSKTVTVRNYNPEQEYVYTTEKVSDTSTINWNTNTIGGTKLFTGNTGSTYYVYTRFKETADTQPGINVRYSSATIDSAVYLKEINLQNYTRNGDGNTIYVPLGQTVTIPVLKEPVNANNWQSITFGCLGTANYSVELFEDTGSNDDAIPTSIRLGGQSLGSSELQAYYNCITGYCHYGSWTVVVYDQSLGVTAPAVSYSERPAYDDVVLYVGDTYTPEAPASGLMLPTSANDQYHYEWRVISSYNITAHYGIENEYIKVDPSTGEVTALKNTDEAPYWAKTVSLEIVANVPKEGVSNEWGVTEYKVDVKSQNVALDSISINPSAVTLYPGDTKTLEVIKNPVNTTVTSSVEWSSDNSNVAVDSTGKITVSESATKGETAIITAKLGEKETTCTVTVDEYQKYDVKVTNGKISETSSTTAKALNGDTLTLIADTVSGKMFKSWEITKGEAYIEDKNSSITSITVTNSNVEITATYLSKEDTVINDVDVTITAPVKGETPKTDASASKEGVNVANVSWEPVPDEKFAENTVYSVEVTLETKEGYRFGADSSVTINGNKAVVVTMSAGELKAYFTFPKTGGSASEVEPEKPGDSGNTGGNTGSGSTSKGDSASYVIPDTSVKESSDMMLYGSLVIGTAAIVTLFIIRKNRKA